MSSWIRSFRKKNNFALPVLKLDAWHQVRTLAFTLFLITVLSGCKSGPPKKINPTVSPINTPSVGLLGKVVFKEGNFNSDGEINQDGRMYGVEREIFVFELTNLRDVEMDEGEFVRYVATNPIDTVMSDVHGVFHIADIEEGQYSLFVKENDRLYSKLGEGDNYLPVTIKKDSLTNILIEIDYLANY